VGGLSRSGGAAGGSEAGAPPDGGTAEPDGGTAESVRAAGGSEAGAPPDGGTAEPDPGAIPPAAAGGTAPSSRIGGYRQVLRTPGLRPLAAAGVVGGIAAQGMPVALVLLGRDATGSFARAGTLLAAATVGNLLLAPARARFVDRRGASTTLPPLGLASAAGSTALALAASAEAALGVLVALAFVAAAFTPPLGAVMRNLWRDLLPEGPVRHAGFGMMTVLQEVTFFGGPLVAGAVIGLADATAAVIALAALTLTASIGFAASPAAREHGAEHGAEHPADTANERKLLGALALPGVRTLTATGALAGAAFGLLDVALPALARHAGTPTAAGALLSAIALGIGIGGFVYGLIPPRAAPGRLYGPLAALAALGLAPVAIAGPDATLVVVGALLVLAGLLFAPVTTCQFALIDDIAPRNMTTETLALLGVAYGAAAAIGAQVAGALVEGTGLRAPLIAATGCFAIAAVVATIGRPTLLPTRATIDAA
jgi:MFS family permease